MKKAFDANVSRARPRVRLGLLGEQAMNEAAVDIIAERVALEAMSVHARPTPPAAQNYASVVPDLAGAVKARAFEARAPKASAAQALQQALQAEAPVRQQIDEELEQPRGRAAVEDFRQPVEESRQPRAHAAFEDSRQQVEESRQPRARAAVEELRHFVEETHPQLPVEAPLRARAAQEAPRAAAPVKVRAAMEAPPQVIEVQNAPLPSEGLDVGERRERLKERLKAVRENPRPEPLPDTVAEAGVLAVERISALQTELVKVRTLNLALTQDLEATRRQSERATEEARLRMDEARRLSSEMEARAKLLNDLERELGALEGERNEALLALQESRQQLDAREHEKDELKTEILKHQQSLSESLSEEERLAAELESAYEASTNLRRSADALRTERDTLARQVSDLTRERAELLEARKALEAVHRALSQAVSR